MQSPDRVTVMVTPPQPLAKLLFAEETWERLRAFARVITNDTDRNWSEDELAEKLAEADGLITSWGTRPLTEAVLQRAPRLQIVAHAAGSIKAVATPAVFARGIIVTSASAALAPAVAESILLHILAAQRNLIPHVESMRAGRWERQQTTELGGKNVGLVGFGLTARELARRLRSCDVSLLVYDPYVSEDVITAAGATPTDLQTLLATCDIVSLHVPDVPANEGMIGARELALMKPGALLVNTARGRVVDEQALVQALAQGSIRACLDVYREEPAPADHPLRQLATVATPHVAGYTYESRLRCGAMAVAQLEEWFVRHVQPPLAVDPSTLSWRA